MGRDGTIQRSGIGILMASTNTKLAVINSPPAGACLTQVTPEKKTLLAEPADPEAQRPVICA
jgi:hypothetical protein